MTPDVTGFEHCALGDVHAGELLGGGDVGTVPIWATVIGSWLTEVATNVVDEFEHEPRLLTGVYPSL